MLKLNTNAGEPKSQPAETRMWPKPGRRSLRLNPGRDQKKQWNQFVKNAVVETVIQNYVADNHPDRHLKAKKGRTLEGEQSNCKTLLLYRSFRLNAIEHG